ncbi:MAG: dihydropteroate synthase [Balneolaceae bacterium]
MAITNAITSLRCGSKTLDLSVPRVMGILNVTPDSFSDGGAFLDEEKALMQAGRMIDAGAAIIDIGGESTRPGSEPVSAQEELGRTIPVLKEAVTRYPDTLFSIDTTKYEVAAQAIEAGAVIVNDVSGLQKEPRFAELCAATGAAYICMHSKGEPKTMQQQPHYNDVLGEVYAFFEEALNKLQRAGVAHVILDPGIGFGKTLEHNLQLIANLQHFAKLNHPLLVGASRKSMIGSVLKGRAPEGRLAGTLAVHYHCLQQGAKLLRVHDVEEAVDSVALFAAIDRHSRDTKKNP